MALSNKKLKYNEKFETCLLGSNELRIIKNSIPKYERKKYERNVR